MAAWPDLLTGSSICSFDPFLWLLRRRCMSSAIQSLEQQHCWPLFDFFLLSQTPERRRKKPWTWIDLVNLAEIAFERIIRANWSSRFFLCLCSWSYYDVVMSPQAGIDYGKSRRPLIISIYACVRACIHVKGDPLFRTKVDARSKYIASSGHNLSPPQPSQRVRRLKRGIQRKRRRN